MKRKIAIVLAVAMAAACLCLAGCSGGLTEEDFVFYDENGNEQEFWEEDGTQYCAADDSSQTVRGIKLGSTLEEVDEAYADVGDAVTKSEVEGSKFYQFKMDNKTLAMIIPESTGVVDVMLITIEP